jgi:NodT family efflux transporter outer membrane factor (OMF) lipoprotein
MTSLLALALMWSVTAAASPATPMLEPGAQYTDAIDGAVSTEPWWPNFGDEALDSLMGIGLRDNLDQRSAWERVAQADAVSWQAFSALVPNASFDVGANLAPLDTLTFQFGGIPIGASDAPDTYYTGSANLNVGWQVDLFGRQSLAFHASRLDRAASEGDAEAQLLALATRLAESYFDAVASKAQVAVIREQLEANTSLLELTELRFARGEAIGVEVLQQRQQVAATEALLPQSRAAWRNAEQRLALLLARQPGQLDIEVAATLPELPAPPSTGTPSDLLTHRPDVQSASVRLGAGKSRAISAALGLLPTVSLQASTGWQFSDFGEFDLQGQWSVGGAMSLPLFQGGRTLGAVRQSKSERDIAWYSFNSTLLTAMMEVEGSVVAVREQTEQLEAARRQEEAARLASDESLLRYRDGIGDYLSVLTSMTSWQRSQLNTLQVHRTALSAHVQLHDALGGIWMDSVARHSKGTP